MTRRKSGHKIDYINGPQIMRLLGYISAHGGVQKSEIEEYLNIGHATAERLLKAARDHFGVKILYTRFHIREPGMPNGEYTIEDWGVFDSRKVKKFLKNRMH